MLQTSVLGSTSWTYEVVLIDDGSTDGTGEALDEAAIMFLIFGAMRYLGMRLPEFIERWTSPDFQEYVAELLRITDALPHPGQQAAFDEVMRHEKEFWRMTWEG